MEFQDILTAVSTVGFPIVAYGGLFWYINKSEQAHRDEVNKLSEAVNNNTVVMQKLLDRCERGEHIE